MMRDAWPGSQLKDYASEATPSILRFARSLHNSPSFARTRPMIIPAKRVSVRPPGGRASHYYSIPRLETTGERSQRRARPVRGESWFDKNGRAPARQGESLGLDLCAGEMVRG